MNELPSKFVGNSIPPAGMKRRHGSVEAESESDEEESSSEQDGDEGEGEEEEEDDEDYQQAREVPNYVVALEQVLRAIERPGDFACGGPIGLCLPGLEVDGVGLVGLPLVAASQLAELKKICTRAPFGRGAATVVDTAVRDTWQLEPNQFRLRNPAWNPSLIAPLLGRVRSELGCEGSNIEGHLYKLLLYEKGQHFVAHRDTEKLPGMFATLVVMLPSAYQGGALVVRHAEAERRFDFAAQNEFGLCYAAFFADCRHELLPVTSGERLCLVYNIRHVDRGLPPPSLVDQSPNAQRVAPLLAKLAADQRSRFAPQKLAYMLDHQYTSEGLSFRVLKNRDRAVAQVLARARESAAVDLYLAIVKCTESGTAEEEGGELDCAEITMSLTDWVGTDDAPAVRHFPWLSESEIVQENYWDDQSPDHVSVEATGNEGAEETRQYQRAALILVPRRSYVT